MRLSFRLGSSRFLNLIFHISLHFQPHSAFKLVQLHQVVRFVVVDLRCVRFQGLLSRLVHLNNMQLNILDFLVKLLPLAVSVVYPHEVLVDPRPQLLQLLKMLVN